LKKRKKKEERRGMSETGLETGAFSVKGVLVEMKDLSDSMLDLAYSAVLYSNPEIAKEVFKLEERMHSLLYKVRIAIMLGARNLEDAVAFSAVLQMAGAAEKISNAAGDIAKIAESVDITRYLDREDFEEAVINVRITPASVLKDRTLKDLQLETETGMSVLAIKRGSEWLYSPEENERLREGDLVISSGPTEGIPVFCKLATCEKYESERKREEGRLKRRRVSEEIADLIAEMKNVSELMVGLSYSAVMFESREIAEEVKELEEAMDGMKEELEVAVLEAAGGVTRGVTEGREGAGAERSNFGELRGLLHVAISSEIISDAAYEIADVVLREIRLHPVFSASIKESDEVILKLEARNEGLFGKTLKELNLETRTGMFVLAIRRAEGRGKWIYNPAGDAVLKAGDLLILRGPREAEAKIKEICGAAV